MSYLKVRIEVYNDDHSLAVKQTINGDETPLPANFVPIDDNIYNAAFDLISSRILTRAEETDVDPNFGLGNKIPTI